MKKIKLVLVAMIMMASASFAQTKPAPWAELKAFHGYMSSTFHPSEEGNFKPLREKADSLYNAAKTWQASAIPSDFKPKETKETIELLVKQTANIKEQVKANASDKDLEKLIAEAHDTFHKIVGECRKKEESHEGHGH